jgi:hypothetical protein
MKPISDRAKPWPLWLVIGGAIAVWASADPAGAQPVVDAGPPAADAAVPAGPPPLSPEDQALVESLEFIEALEMMEGLDVLVDP